MKTTLILTVLIFCLASAPALAQTPAQDANNIAADEDALANAKDNVRADKTQLQIDERNNKDAVQSDTDRLITDQQAQSGAAEKLRYDKKTLEIDDNTFNGDGQPAKGMSGVE